MPLLHTSTSACSTSVDPRFCPNTPTMWRRLVDFAFYQWPRVGIGWGIAGGVLTLVLLGLEILTWPMGMACLIACAYTFHQFEEYVIPGGFVEDFTQNFLGLKDLDRILDARTVFWVNIPLIWIGLPTLALLTIFHDRHWLAGAGYFSLLAGFAHLIPIAKSRFTRWYNPGLAMSVLLNIPLGIVGIVMTWDTTSKIHNGCLFVMLLFWMLFVNWGLSLARRYNRTGDPHYRRAAVELFVLYAVVGLAAVGFYMLVD